MPLSTSLGLRTSTRLMLSFIAAHLALSAVGGLTAWWLVDRSLRHQAEDSARNVGRVLDGGGFSPSPEVLARMRRLTGAEFNLLDQPTPVRPGTVQVIAAGRVIEIDYRSASYRAAERAVVLGSLAVAAAGALVFALIAVVLARRFARPLDRLAFAARQIGAGSLDEPVPAVGSGEIAALAAELERMRVRLIDLDRANRQAERLATVGTFTATIAHELRNPLSAVRLTVQMLAERHGDDPALRMIEEELERLDLSVDELLGFSKGMTIEPVACDLGVVAADVVRLLRRQAGHAGVKLTPTGTATAGAVIVRADPRRLRQLLVNLVLNAVQAVQGAGRDDGGMVAIRIQPDGFVVEDDGPGVDPALVPRLFDAFAGNRPGGTGLGLHLARAVAEAHGARLTYAPRVGGGAVFTLAGLHGAMATESTKDTKAERSGALSSMD